MRRCLLGTGISTVFPFSWIKSLWLRYLRSQKEVRILGHRMLLDAGDVQNLAVNGVTEPVETDWFEAHVRPGQVVVDLGANIGYFTLLFARWVGTRGRVYAFEPAPDNFALLEQNVRLNGYQNVVLEQKAVSDVTGPVTLYMKSDRPVDHRIFPDEQEPCDTLAIQAVRLDDYAPLLNQPVEYIKMDIQGAEPKALLGMREFFRRNPQVKLLVEFWPYGLLRAGEDPLRLIALLREHGLELQVFDLQGHLRPLGAEENLLESCGGTQYGDYVNLLCAQPAAMRALGL